MSKTRSHTKKGPGRVHHSPVFGLQVQRDEAPLADRRPIPANVGRNPRRKWREGEPVRIVRPVRAVMRALK